MASTRRKKRVRRESSPAPYIPPAELDRIIAAQGGINALRNRAALFLTHYLGVRAKELAALRIGDLWEPNAGEIREVVRLKRSMTKGSKFREVPFLNQNAREAVAKYIATRGVRRPDSPLIASQKGGGFSANTMEKMLAGLYHRAGVDASSHSGRRSFANYMLRAGADIYSLKTLMGHVSINATERYLTTDIERLKGFAARI